VPSINFLSGGQSPEEVTANLNAINILLPNAPWALSFSYACALQRPSLQAWAGKAENGSAQQVLYHRAQLNGWASCGKYSSELEK